MRILLISAYFPPENGSAANLYHELACELVRRGHWVTVLTGMPGYHVTGPAEKYLGQRFLREEMDGISIVRVAAPRFARTSMTGRGIWQLAMAVALAYGGLRTPAHDVALIYSPPLFLGLSAWVVRLGKGTPFILNVQDLFPQSAIDLGALKSRPMIAALRAVERFVYKRAAQIVVHSEGNREKVAASGVPKEKISVISNWLDLRPFRVGATPDETLRRLGLEGKKVMTFAGVLGYAQDGDVILEAASRLLDQGAIRFLVVGEGVEAPRLKLKADAMQLNNLRFLPLQPKAAYAEILRASCASLVTLREDMKTPVVPSKIGSIMASGRPVIAALPPESDASALITGSGAGLAVPAGDADALAGAIRKIAENDSAAAEMGERGRRFAEEHLAVAAAAERLEVVFAKSRRT